MKQETETERQRIEAWRWEVVASIVGEAWAEQQGGVLNNGLVYHYVKAIFAKAAWMTYRYRHGVWLTRPESHNEVKVWHATPPAERGAEPGPSRPAGEEPEDRDLPAVGEAVDGRGNRSAEDDAVVYLTACSMRAGHTVVSSWATRARSAYPWARGAVCREVA